MDGIINVHKTAGPTSHDIVGEVRRIFGMKRVGHAGTLDPMATGVLIVCLGKATRIVEYLMGTAKEYRARMVLGQSTDTQDGTGNITAESDASGVTREALENAVRQFIGEIRQVPPMISALKHKGTPLYKLARKGESVERQPRAVFVHSIDVTSFNPGPRAEAGITVRCGSGTYIRTLCSDIGDMLGCGGHMSVLERTTVGPFRIEDAVSLDTIKEAKDQGHLEEMVVSMADALTDMPSVSIGAAGLRDIVYGLRVEVDASVPVGTVVRVMDAGNELAALGTVLFENGRTVVRPNKVFAELKD